MRLSNIMFVYIWLFCKQTDHNFTLKKMKNKETDMSNGVNDQRITKIANKIKALRIQKGYTSHEAFAWDYNLNRVQYWRMEKGSNITLKTLFSILDIHEISLSSFFCDIE